MSLDNNFNEKIDILKEYLKLGKELLYAVPKSETKRVASGIDILRAYIKLYTLESKGKIKTLEEMTEDEKEVHFKQCSIGEVHEAKLFDKLKNKKFPDKTAMKIVKNPDMFVCYYFQMLEKKYLK